jgi:hypothetical protein
MRKEISMRRTRLRSLIVVIGVVSLMKVGCVLLGTDSAHHSCLLHEHVYFQYLCLSVNINSALFSFSLEFVIWCIRSRRQMPNRGHAHVTFKLGVRPAGSRL